MVFDLIAGVILSLIEPLVAVLPEFTVADVPEGVAEIRNVLYAADQWVPILGPVRLIALVLGWAAPVIAISLVVWVWRLLPFT